MSSRLKVELILKDKDWPGLRSIIAQPRTTVDIAYRWLIDRGYAVSRNAVWNYLKAARQPGAMNFTNDADARRQAWACLKRLSGQHLFAVASYALFMGRANGKKGSVRRSI